jgi:hypothetical protein
LRHLFLIRGLILLATAALLVSLTWFVWHLIRLAGLVTLLRWIRLILLCHVSSPDYQRALLRARATSADRHLDWHAIGGVALNHPQPVPRRNQKAYAAKDAQKLSASISISLASFNWLTSRLLIELSQAARRLTS